MISWIQHHLIRHGRWIFLTLLALIIVAFVFTIGNTPGCTTDRSGYQENLYYGIDLNAPRERDLIIEKVQLSAFLKGQQIRSEQQFQSQLTNRIALLHLADEIGVPGPDSNALAAYIQEQNAFRGPDGAFSADSYTAFVDSVESNPRSPQGLVVTVLNEDYRIEQISSAISGPGYLLPSEALAQAQRSRTRLEVNIAEFLAADFDPQISPESEALRAFYEANDRQYQIPERIKAAYVLFEASEFAGMEPEATEAELRDHFIANRAEIVAQYEADNATAEAEADDGSEEAGVTFADVRELVAEDYRSAQRDRLANQAAQTFAYTLYRDEIKRDSAAFNTLLNQSGLKLVDIAPYTLAAASQRALSPEMLESAFNLGGNRYYSDAYQVESGFAVLIYKGRIAPEIPAFESVEAEVRSDYIAQETRRLFNEKASELQNQLQSLLSEGSDFNTAAESLGLKAQSFESFEVQEAPAELNRSLVQQAQNMQAGEVSPLIRAGGSSAFVHLENKEVPAIEADDENLTQAEDFLARFAAFSSANAFVSELVSRGLPETALPQD